jgi:hypothetical protein
MNERDYQMTKQYGYQSVGMFGDEIYAYEILTGFASIPEYYQITKQEYDTFDQWKDQNTGELDIMYEIHNRKPLCSAYKDKTELNSISKELVCPTCGTHFLIDGGDIPKQIDITQICPVCNKRPQPKMELMLEVKKQLQLAGLRVRNLGSLFTSYYIDPFSKLDMRGYVFVGSTNYYLRVNERGNVIIEYCVTDKRKAAYWILTELLYTMEYNLLSEEEKYQVHTDKMIIEKCRVHFSKMESMYKEWFESEIGIFNFREIL